MTLDKSKDWVVAVVTSIKTYLVISFIYFVHLICLRFMINIALIQDPWSQNWWLQMCFWMARLCEFWISNSIFQYKNH